MIEDTVKLLVNYSDTDILHIHRRIDEIYDNITKQYLVVNNVKSEEHILKQDYNMVIDGILKKCPGEIKVSDQHALALHLGIKYLLENNMMTRFLIIVNGDFFLYYSLQEVLDDVDYLGLHFFGVPYTYTEYEKKYCSRIFKQNYPEIAKNIMGFPTVFFQVIDTTKVDVSKLNYLPSYSDTGDSVIVQHCLSPWAIAPFAGGWGNSNLLNENFKREIYKYKEKLFGIHCRMRAYQRNNKLEFGRRLLQKYLIDDFENSKVEIDYVINQNFFGDGTYPNNVIGYKGHEKYGR